jgi:diguanylate cyclase (GGDEF)-like protein
MRSASVDFNQIYAVLHTAEMLFVLGALMIYNHRLATMFEAASKANRLLKAEQLRDGLTGAASRVTAGEYFMQNAWRNHVAVVMVDVDKFKQVNDRWGHDVGDLALIELVTQLRQGLRVNDHIVRWGGEEFLLMFPAKTEFDLAARCEQLRNAIKRGFERNSNLPNISASFGAVLANPAADPEFRNWIRSADLALLAAKSKGRDQVVFSRNGAIVPVRLEGAESLGKAADRAAA